jgi:hypothetical protein
LLAKIEGRARTPAASKAGSNQKAYDSDWTRFTISVMQATSRGFRSDMRALLRGHIGGKQSKSAKQIFGGGHLERARSFDIELLHDTIFDDH